jgi:membrane protein involved in colicin uptake
MSTTQGEPKQSIKATIIGGALAIIAIAGVVGGVAVASDNARQEAAHQHLLASVKTSGLIMQAATAEDAAVNADAVQAAAIQHTDQLAAQAEAAKVAAQKAAAAKAAALKAAQEAAAAQQAAQQAAAQQQSAQQASGPSAPSAPSGPVRCPAGSQANSGDASGDTSCFPNICFHFPLPDPNHPECVTPFKP